ncbi:MAG: GNAT family N-acetyltransferase, partial [Pseudomonadota bacterium]
HIGEGHLSSAVALIHRDGRGKMTFTDVTAKQRSVDHTEVDESLGGTGAGKALATRMVELAREDGVYLIPICPFFRATAKKHPEWHDIVQMPKETKAGAN